MKTFYALFAALFLLTGCPPPFENPPHQVADVNDMAHRAVDRDEIMKAARVRRAPSYPKIGSFLNQSKTICSKQGGTFSYNEDISSAVCSVSSLPIFQISMEEDIIIGITVFFEAGDISDIGEMYIARLGTPSYTLDRNNRVVMNWIDGNFEVQISSYELGVISKVYFRGSRGPIFAMPDSTRSYFDYDDKDL